MDKMKEPDIDDLLEQLEEAQERGQALTVEEVCANHPELIETVRERWQKLIRFNEAYCTRRESTAEVERKVSAMPENMNGKHVVVQSDLRIEDFVDRGGLGDVYRANDTELGREVAIKLLRADRKTESNQEDFQREVKIMGGMVHPGIMSIYGCGETIDGREFYTMPYVDRGNLRASVMEYHALHRSRVDDGSKEFRDLLYRMVSICKTIAYAHSRGIVHRDLKTENVVLGKYGETFVIDWGCATKVKRGEKFKVAGEGTLNLGSAHESSSSAGLTLRYASPEQLHGGREIGPESDIYGLGAMLYLLLTGSSPLETTPDEEVRKTVIAGHVPAAETIKAGIPHPLSEICAKAMSTNPASRYETGMEMAEDLERFLADETVSVCKDSVAVQVGRVVRRNRTASFVLVGTLLLAAVLLGLLSARNGHVAEQAEIAAQERLRMASTLTAKLGGFEINRRLNLLEDVASRPALGEAIKRINEQPEDKDRWRDAQEILQDFQEELDATGLYVESLYINDLKGVQVSRVPKRVRLPNGELKSTIGRRYAYRNYFNGLDEDLEEGADAEISPDPILSRPYVSTNPNDEGAFPVKVSFSVPIQAISEDGQEQTIGRIGMSVEINKLGLFEELKSLSLDALLVELDSFTWGTKSSEGLILDRLRRSDGYAVAKADDKQMAENEVKDRMARLAPKTIELIKTSLQDSEDAIFVEDLMDPIVSTNHENSAIARMSVPGHKLKNDWIVVFIESEDRLEN